MEPLSRPKWNFLQKRDPNILWLDKNECNYLTTRNLVKKIYNNIDIQSLSTYPDLTRAYDLFHEKLKVRQESAYFTYGSDSAIRIFFEYCSKINKSIRSLLLRPSFGMYEVYAKYYGNEVSFIDYDYLTENYKFNYKKIILEIDKLKKGDIFILASPESPLGIAFEEKEIYKFIKKCNDKKVFFLLDETYIGFSNTKSQRNLIETFPNLFITGSFSKSWGLAGVRLGYLISNEENIKQAKLSRLMYEIGGFQYEILRSCLEHYQEFQDALKEQIFYRNKFVNLLRNNNLKVINTSANFIHLEKKSINLNSLNRLSEICLFKEINHNSLSHTIRITMPDPIYFDKILNVLEK